MKQDRLPIILVGRSVELHSIRSLMDLIGARKLSTASHFLRSLRIPIIYIGEEGYFSLSTLERALFYVSRPGSVGFIAPGSSYRNRGRYAYRLRHKGADPPGVLSLTEEDAVKMNDPKYEREMEAVAKHRATNVKIAARNLRRAFSTVEGAFDGKQFRQSANRVSDPAAAGTAAATVQNDQPTQ